MNKKMIKGLALLLALSLLLLPACTKKEAAPDGDTKNGETQETGDGTPNEYSGQPLPPPRPFSVDTRLVGQEGYGYVEIPTDWMPLNQLGVDTDALYYSDTSGNYTLSLAAQPDAGNLKDFHRAQSENFQLSGDARSLTLDGTAALSTTDTIEEGQFTLTLWTVLDPDGTGHILTLKSSTNWDYDEEIVTILEESYRLNAPLEETPVSPAES